MTCNNNALQLCGGSNAIDIYEANTSPVVAEPEPTPEPTALLKVTDRDSWRCTSFFLFSSLSLADLSPFLPFSF
jgi:hypothetical protein